MSQLIYTVTNSKGRSLDYIAQDASSAVQLACFDRLVVSAKSAKVSFSPLNDLFTTHAGLMDAVLAHAIRYTACSFNFHTGYDNIPDYVTISRQRYFFKTFRTPSPIAKVIMT